MREWSPLLVIGALSGLIYLAGFDVAPEVAPTRLIGFLYLPLFALFLASAWWVWRTPGLSPWPIIVAAVVFRLMAATDPPGLSSDSYRYAWDGRVQRAGLNPYEFAPGDPALSSLRDTEIHPNINRPTARTVYPPGAQVLYRFLPYDIDGLRWLMIAFDALTMILLVRLLRTLGKEPAQVLVYAWCPLVVYEIGNNGHVEAAFLPLLVGAVLAYRARRTLFTGLLLGAATAIKLYPALAIVALAKRHPRQIIATMGLLIGGLYVAYGWSVYSKVLGFLPEYVGVAEDHNIGLRRVIENTLPSGVSQPREVAFACCVCLLVGGAAFIYRTSWPIERQLLGVAGLYLLTLPTAFHPWYALWLVPWLCIYPSAGWLWLLAMLPLSYLKYDSAGGLMPGWVTPLEFLPTVALLAYEGRQWRP